MPKRHVPKKTLLEELTAKQTLLRKKLFQAHYSNMGESIKSQINDALTLNDINIQDEIERQRFYLIDKETPDALDSEEHGKKQSESDSNK